MTNVSRYPLSPDFNGFIKKNPVLLSLNLLLDWEFTPVDLLIFKKT